MISGSNSCIQEQVSEGEQSESILDIQNIECSDADELGISIRCSNNGTPEKQNSII